MRPRITPSGVLATGAIFVAMSGTAVAATGGSFILGKTNKAGATSTLKSSHGSPLSLVAPSGKAPLTVNNSVQVAKLNASLLGGKSASQLQATSVLYLDFTYDTTNHVGAAPCPSGWVATGGGYAATTPAVPEIATTITAKSTTSSNMIDGYVAVLFNTDGTPFTGTASVEVRCVAGTSHTTQPPSTGATPALRAALLRAAR